MGKEMKSMLADIQFGKGMVYLLTMQNILVVISSSSSSFL
jgi:hypothetical protein